MLAGSAHATDSEWKLRERGEDRGQAFAVYEAEVEGSSYPAYRVETLLSAPIETSVEAAMQVLVTPSRAPENQRRTLLAYEDGAYYIHTRIEVPFVSDRDVTVRVERFDDPASSAVELRWRAVTDHGPPLPRNTVRIPRSEGSWRFSQVDPAVTRARYENHTDIGGSLPSWMVESMLRDEAVSQIGTLRESLSDVVVRASKMEVADASPASDTERAH